MVLRTLLFLVVLSLASPTLAEQGNDSEYTEPLTGMKFVRVKGGSFTMGDVYGTDVYAKPPHKVTVDDFYMGVFEVTFAQYDLFCDSTRREKAEDRGMGRGRRPVINVSRQDAIAFTEWLSSRDGKKFRLPSEAEWEYAARGGKSTPFWWGNRLGSGNANCKTCGSPWDGMKTAPVGSFAPNPFGLYDTVGNVYEWVLDSWHPDYRNAPDDGSARIDPQATEFVSRGGSYLEVASSLSAAARNWGPPAAADDIGFRVLLEIE